MGVVRLENQQNQTHQQTCELINGRIFLAWYPVGLAATAHVLTFQSPFEKRFTILGDETRRGVPL
jgi:hypothetical protein